MFYINRLNYHFITSLKFIEFMIVLKRFIDYNVQNPTTASEYFYIQQEQIICYILLSLSSEYARLQWSQLLNTLPISLLRKPMSTRVHL